MTGSGRRRDVDHVVAPVSGPGSAYLADRAAISTTVTSLVAGSYVPRATASDGATVSADVTFRRLCAERPSRGRRSRQMRFSASCWWIRGRGRYIPASSNGDTINLTELTRRKVNIRADVAAMLQRAVRLRQETRAVRRSRSFWNRQRPAVLVAGQRGSTRRGGPTVGTHRLVATPFDAAKGRGMVEPLIEVTFNVIKAATAIGAERGLVDRRPANPSFVDADRGQPRSNPRRNRPADSQLLERHVPELHARAVAEEADVALRALQAGVLLQDGLVLDVVEVGVDDRLAVQLDRDPAALGGDLLRCSTRRPASGGRAWRRRRRRSSRGTATGGASLYCGPLSSRTWISMPT